MSILTFLADLFHKIFGGLTSEQKEIVKISNDVINAIKSGLSFDTALESVLSVVPEDLKAKFLDNVVSILFKVGLITSMDVTIAEAITEAGAHIKELGDDTIHKIKLNSLGQLLIDVLADGKIGWDDLAHLPKLFFKYGNK